MNFKQFQKLPLWRLVGPLLVIAVIYWAGPAKVWNVLSTANLALVAGALVLAIPLAIIKGVRWKILLNGAQIEISLRESVSMYAIGMTMAALTPGRVGDFIKLVPLLQKGCRISKAIACSVFDRLLDVVFVLIIGYAGMWYFSQYLSSQLRLINAVAAGILVAVLIIVVRRNLFKKIAMKVVPSRYRAAVRESWKEVVEGFLSKGFVLGLRLAIWTVLFWLIRFFAVYLCSSALGLEIPFLYLSACVVVVTVASFVPITVAGAGTRDAIFILLLEQIGLPREEIVALSSLVLVVSLLYCVAFYLVWAILKSKSN